MTLEELQELYARINGAKMYAANKDEMSVAIILDKVLDVVYEKAKGLIDDVDAERKKRRDDRIEYQLELERWEGEGGDGH